MASDSLIVDLTGYRDRTGSRVEPGRYKVQIEEVESDKTGPNSKKPGTPMINLWFRIVGGEYDGHTVVDRLVLMDTAMFRFVGFMQALGLPTPRKRIKVNIAQFVGKTLQIDVEDGDPYNGRVKSEVRGYLKVSGGDASEESEDLDEDVSDEPTEDAEPKAEKRKATSPPSADSPEDALGDLEEIDLDEVSI